MANWSKEKTTKAGICIKYLERIRRSTARPVPIRFGKWIAEGRITSRTQLRTEESNEWKPVSEFREFDAALAARTPLAPTASPGAAAAMPPAVPTSGSPSAGLAITSMVLGILSFVGCSIFTGIPAIITGHIAHGRARKRPEQYAGGGFAIAGFVMGYVSLVFIPILAGMMLPALAKAKEKAQRINCVSNLKQIGLAARMWSNDHNGKFPPDFVSMSNELVTPKILVCPGDSAKSRMLDWSEFRADNVSYEYLQPGIDERSAPQTVVFQCPIHGNVGLIDGSVQQRGQRTGRLNR